MVRICLGRDRPGLFDMTIPHCIADILHHTGPVLLDFDGPVCAVFGSVPSSVAAEKLRTVITRSGFSLPAAVIDESDPLEILRYVGRNGDQELLERTEDQLCRVELDAVEEAIPTPYADQLISAIKQSGRTLIIVSNNSSGAIRAYFTRLGMPLYPDQIVGRPYARPAGMKPDPRLVREAVTLSGVESKKCVLIGDSATDIQAGRAVGVRTIGYANKPGKYDHLIAAGADAVAEGEPGIKILASSMHAAE